MMFDWSLAQDEWSDEQKNVWQQAELAWNNITHSQWIDIEQSEEWQNFANNGIKNTFKKKAFNDDVIKIKAWRLINLLMIIYPSSDVYTHNYNNSILFGRKNPPKKGQAWLYLPNDSKFLRLEICIKISQMRDARKAIMPHVQLDDEDINIIKTKIASFLQKTNPDGLRYADGLKNIIKDFEGREKRLLPTDYLDNTSTLMFFDWSLAQDEWSDEQKNVWADIEKMWRNFDFTNWNIIENSQEWKSFADNAIKKAFTEKHKDDTSRIHSWRLINLLMQMYPELDVYSHNDDDGADIIFGRKSINTKQRPRILFFLDLNNFQYRQLRINRPNDNVIKDLNDNKAESVLNQIADFLQKTIDNTTHGQYLQKQFQPITRQRHLPKDYKPVSDRLLTNNPTHPLNVIFYGPPGTGKTYTTMERAMRICEGNDFDDKISREELVKQYKEYIDEERIVFTTFHQSYSYEDFIEGIRATTENNTINYKVQDGVFKELCKNAAQSPDENFVIIIDEINRGNISRIFGELITLIEDSKRTGELEEITVKLPYSRESFSVPQNVYIIGTMNTADRSLAGLDLALRRRFTFEEMRPKTELLKGIKIEGIKIDELLSIMNQRIEVLLDREHTIGHAYFMELKNDSPIEKLAEIFQNKILPLLQEYFFDDWSKINSVLGENGFISKKDGDKALFKVKDSIDEKTIWQINTGAFAEKQKYIDIYQMA